MEVKSYIKMELSFLDHIVDRALKDLTQVDLSWRPAAGCNPIGLILYHCARLEDNFVQGTLTKKPQVFEKWCKKMNKPLEDVGAHYSVDQVNAFIVPDLKDILDYWAEARKATIAYVDSLSEADLEKTIKMPWGNSSVAGLLSLTVAHSIGHVGEMSYLRGIYRGMDK